MWGRTEVTHDDWNLDEGKDNHRLHFRILLFGYHLSVKDKIFHVKSLSGSQGATVAHL
jgi:hypothetical protein